MYEYLFTFHRGIGRVFCTKGSSYVASMYRAIKLISTQAVVSLMAPSELRV